MTRKRFIRMVMSCEFQRNEAERFARRINEYGSYKELFSSIESILLYQKCGVNIMRGLAAGIAAAAKNPLITPIGYMRPEWLTARRTVLSMSHFIPREDNEEERYGAGMVDNRKEAHFR